MINTRKILEVEIRKLNIIWGTTNFCERRTDIGRLSQVVKFLLVSIQGSFQSTH